MHIIKGMLTCIMQFPKTRNPLCILLAWIEISLPREAEKYSQNDRNKMIFPLIQNSIFTEGRTYKLMKIFSYYNWVLHYSPQNNQNFALLLKGFLSTYSVYNLSGAFPNIKSRTYMFIW